VFAEPGAAAAYAAYSKSDCPNHDHSVILITGSGLKDIGTLVSSGILEKEFVSGSCGVPDVYSRAL
jgi:threonine synthase